jgi:WD40 repeat protein
VSGSTDGTIRVWDLSELAETSPPAGHDGPVSALLFADAGTLLSGSADGTLRTWSLDGREMDVRSAGLGQIWSLCSWSEDGFAAATQGGRIIVVGNSASGFESLPGHPTEAHVVVALSDGRIVSADKSGNVLVWTPNAGGWHRRQVDIPPVFRDIVGMAAIEPSRVAIAWDSHVLLVDIGSGATTELRDREPDAVCGIAAGQRGTVLTGSRDGTARIWDPSGPTILRRYDGHTGSDVSALAVLDEELIVSGSGDGAVRVWRADNGETVALARLDQPVDCIAVDPGDRRIAVGHASGSFVVLSTMGLGSTPQRKSQQAAPS